MPPTRPKATRSRGHEARDLQTASNSRARLRPTLTQTVTPSEEIENDEYPLPETTSSIERAMEGVDGLDDDDDDDELPEPVERSGGVPRLEAKLETPPPTSLLLAPADETLFILDDGAAKTTLLIKTPTRQAFRKAIVPSLGLAAVLARIESPTRQETALQACQGSQEPSRVQLSGRWRTTMEDDDEDDDKLPERTGATGRGHRCQYSRNLSTHITQAATAQQTTYPHSRAPSTNLILGSRPTTA
ncbi:hypothetical protein LTR56_014402 [Elasticomyces elasticus]|nr:hypothetical protein LTR22_020555 [Elasticomyces elasticus]KAK3636026.1 hypothetical protein LTR56_014402 [Elasticomyces elasticus]KAK4916669.1 hypothetical protein LTR49_015367 [Elasticomyces elasticus]KAK5754943.1 hypothetical protein LTS12_014976 [Elasticomyces elasticus]